MRSPSRPNGATVRMSASSRLRTYSFTSRPCRLRSRIGYATSCPGPWYVDLPPRSVSTISTSALSGRCSSALSSVRRPSVTTGGCSSRITVSGIAPCETAPASERCRSQASRYGTCPSSSRYAPLLTFPVLEAFAEVAQEAARVGAVDEAMVVGERDVHDRLDRDRVVAVLVGHDPRALDERVRPEDRRL